MVGTMRIRPFKTRELLLLILVLWAVCSLVLWRIRGSCTTPQPTKPCREEVNIRPQPLHPVVDELAIHNSERAVSFPPRTNAMTPVYVVEEHHEVLPYWYDAANRGLIPGTGNTLLHIDGHSDGATPFQWEKIPLFRPPRNSKEITSMMQQNDVFVVASALTGLINRYIWVWPPWDTSGSDSEHPNQVDYQKMDVRVGTTFRMQRGTRKLELCACFTSKTTKCYMNNVTAESETDGEGEEGIPMEESDCTVRTTGVIEIVSERRAKLLMRSGTWITPEDSVILDIDEDYYGCEAVVLPLYASGLNESVIRDISMWVEFLICAKGTEDERMVDNWYRSVVQTVIDYKSFCKGSDLRVNTCTEKEITSSLWKMIPRFLRDLKERNAGEFCKRNPDFILKMLLAHFSSLTVSQLRALIEIGVCLNMSPKTLEFKTTDNMRVCDGYNRPNDTMVVFHTPDLDEIDDRTASLEMIIDSRRFTPRIVTICRSTRDGYTPRKHFKMIESDVLKTLINSFPEISKHNIYYDKDLLGGAFGWHGRH